ncbi:MAG: hypothetical protein R3Y13_02790 [bacterium]
MYNKEELIKQKEILKILNERNKFSKEKYKKLSNTQLVSGFLFTVYFICLLNSDKHEFDKQEGEFINSSYESTIFKNVNNGDFILVHNNKITKYDIDKNLLLDILKTNTFNELIELLGEGSVYSSETKENKIEIFLADQYYVFENENIIKEESLVLSIIKSSLMISLLSIFFYSSVKNVEYEANVKQFNDIQNNINLSTEELNKLVDDIVNFKSQEAMISAIHILQTNGYMDDKLKYEFDEFIRTYNISIDEITSECNKGAVRLKKIKVNNM